MESLVHGHRRVLFEVCEQVWRPRDVRIRHRFGQFARGLEPVDAIELQCDVRGRAGQQSKCPKRNRDHRVTPRPVRDEERRRD